MKPYKILKNERVLKLETTGDLTREIFPLGENSSWFDAVEMTSISKEVNQII